MKIAYITGGNAGAGHLMRGLAIERGLRRSGVKAEYKLFIPALPYAIQTKTAIQNFKINYIELSDPFLSAESHLCRTLQAFQPDLVLVDLFWALAYYILPLLRCEAWLLVRSCPELWFSGEAAPGVQFNLRQYQRIIGIEPGGCPISHELISPIVFANPDECQPSNALREHLAVPPDRPLVVASQAGKEGEYLELIKKEPEVFWFDFQNQSLFPACEWLGGADRVYSGTGYNAFWEAHWLGYADRTRFTPFPRSIDNQHWRLQNCRSYTMKENGADTLAKQILG